jgi:TRAP-type mannitol/chloroaromatic compound transport system substrate-binding protein
MGFHKIAKYYYYPGWHEPGTTMETFINKDRFASLPADLQEILLTAIARQNMWTLCEFEAKNNSYLEKLVEEEEVILREFPRDVLAALRVLTEEVLQEIISTDEMSRKVFASYQAFRKGASAWSRIAEKNFYENIQQV